MMTTLNLFCLPFAGGNKYSYRGYGERAPSFLNIVTLEYPGRGARLKEPLLSNIKDLVNDMYS
jgi:surfactin synthase thioesterase subunit